MHLVQPVSEMNMITRKKNRGLSLIELMVSMAVSLLLFAGLMAFYVDTLESNGLSLKSSRLNQEASAVMGVMINEIRRAGSDGGGDPVNNAFNNSNTTKLNIIKDWVSDATDFIAPEDADAGDGGNCVLFTYDGFKTGSRNGVVTADEYKGYRRNIVSGVGVVEMLRLGTASSSTRNCNGANEDWVQITDPGLVNVTALNFRMVGMQHDGSDPVFDSICMNTTLDAGDYDVDGGGLGDTEDGPTHEEFETITNSPTLELPAYIADNSSIDCGEDCGDGDDHCSELQCYRKHTNCYEFQAGSGHITVERRRVHIRLDLELVEDSLVQVSMEHDVAVRNDILTEMP